MVMGTRDAIDKAVHEIQQTSDEQVSVDGEREREREDRQVERLLMLLLLFGFVLCINKPPLMSFVLTRPSQRILLA